MAPDEGSVSGSSDARDSHAERDPSPVSPLRGDPPSPTRGEGKKHHLPLRTLFRYTRPGSISGRGILWITSATPTAHPSRRTSSSAVTAPATRFLKTSPTS